MIEELEADPTQKFIGYYNSGSVICYDNVNLTGVRSIDLSMAKGMGDPGRVAILVDGNDLGTGTNLGEKITLSTGGWTTFKTLSVGLSQELTGNRTLCFFGVSGLGIMNLDKFTLSDVPAQNDGITPDPDEIPQNAPPIAKITTQGNKVLFGGQSGSIAGVSLFWSNDGWGGDKFYNADVVKWLKQEQEWDAKLIRVAMGVEAEGGYIESPESNKRRVKTVVNAAIENGMYVIIDWHSHEAESYKSQAIEFFTEMAKTYGEFNNVIYEVYNEPLEASWTGVIKPYAEDVIAEIRKHDPDNLVIVGTRTWSQRVDEAANNPITRFTNIAYTLHFYADTHKQDIRNYAMTALSKNIPLFVTEWGTVAASGDGNVNQSETQTWMNFLKTNGISHANWALNDKAEGSSALVPGASITGGWTDAQLTPSGKLVKGIIKNW